jgi:bifunctional DNase/RNase
MHIRMTVTGLRMDPATGTPVVVLTDESGVLALPIWIGAAEAHAIAVQIESIRLARPLTHDLLGTMVTRLGAELLRVEVNDLRDGTFYAALVVRRESETHAIDSRPSDAIALAMRTGAPIFVARKVLDSAQTVSLTKDPWQQVIESLPESVYGKYKH